MLKGYRNCFCDASSRNCVDVYKRSFSIYILRTKDKVLLESLILHTRFFKSNIRVQKKKHYSFVLYKNIVTMNKGTVAFSADFEAVYALFLCDAIGLTVPQAHGQALDQ